MNPPLDASSVPPCPDLPASVPRVLVLQHTLEEGPGHFGIRLAHPGARYPDALRRHPDTVQDAQAMHRGTSQHLSASQAFAERIYATWQRRWASLS